MKPTLIFTTFWDANTMVRNGGIILPDGSTIQVSKEDVYSIALSCPSEDKIKYVGKPQRIKPLCPTYDILAKYKATKDWTEYVPAYKRLLRKRDREIRTWLNSLENEVYVLCCWENTCKDAKCHRQILYEIFDRSQKAKGICDVVYRHGNENKRSTKTIASTTAGVKLISPETPQFVAAHLHTADMFVTSESERIDVDFNCQTFTRANTGSYMFSMELLEEMAETMGVDLYNGECIIDNSHSTSLSNVTWIEQNNGNGNTNSTLIT